MNRAMPELDALPESRKVGLSVAHFAVAVISVYLVVVVATLLWYEPDRYLIPAWLACSVAGAAYFARPSSDALRTTWLVLLTVCALGRSMTLLFMGAEYLSRGLEIAASMSWLIVWLAGILAALVLTADQLLRGK